ncbi:MAG: hypothetical protein M3162_00235 [Thermoproteota archaeon]|nr:hypothetical protein [Thermoproteota archaeon]
MIKMEMFEETTQNSGLNDINEFLRTGNRKVINIQLSPNPTSGSNKPFVFYLFYDEE